MSRKSSIIIKEKKIGLTSKANLLNADFILDQVKIRVLELQTLLIEKKNALKNAPEGSLRIAQSGNRIQYYHKTTEENPQGKYLTRSQDNLAAALAQKDYDQKIVKELEDEIATLEKFFKNYDPERLVQLFEDMHINRQHLINPSAVSDENFEKAWASYTYEGLPFSDEEEVFITQKGEKVRTKEQLSIANTLNQMEIPYRFEYPLMLKGSGGFSTASLVYPTFYCLNIHSRKEFIWEHFEKSDDAEKLDSHLGVITQYQNSGFIQGDNLITTFSTTNTPLDEKQIALLAEKFFK